MEHCVLGGRRIISSFLTDDPYGDSFLGLTISIHAGVDKFPCHELSPFSDTSLKCPELTVWEVPGALLLKTIKQRLCRRIRITL